VWPLVLISQAAVGLASALAAVVTGKGARPSIAMIGGLTLDGGVVRVAGIAGKVKCLVGVKEIKTLLVAADNLEEATRAACLHRGLEIQPVGTVWDVIRFAHLNGSGETDSAALRRARA
jgi:ATP-dependent Lon protease